jgi:hypothetical protein
MPEKEEAVEEIRRTVADVASSAAFPLAIDMAASRDGGSDAGRASPYLWIDHPGGPPSP